MLCVAGLREGALLVTYSWVAEYFEKKYPFTAVTGIQLLFPRVAVDGEFSSSRHDFIREWPKRMNDIYFCSMCEGHCYSSNSKDVYIPKYLADISHVWMRINI